MNSHKQLLLLQGLPASGKTTYALKLCSEDPNWIRLNKDDIREFIGTLPWTRELENTIIQIQRLIAFTYVNYGKCLIVDDTNFQVEYVNYWQEFANAHNYEFIKLIFNTPVEECIDRDSKRTKSVGKDVILKMYEKYLKKD